MKNFKFEIIKRDGRARTGRLHTPHGVIETPNFVPVGTAATVKTLTSDDLKEIGAQIVLSNTYHLQLQPGSDVVAKMGGLHRFMGWDGPLMTDSGGFQVFSLGVAQEYVKLSKFTRDQAYSIRMDEMGDTFRRQLESKTGRVRKAKIDQDGVSFYSHLDGSMHRLDPKISIGIQEKLGADLIVCFDDHESPLWNRDQTKASLDRSHRWSLESIKAHHRSDQMMFGVVHGGIFEDLRVSSAELINQNFAAIAIGGAYTSKDVLYQVINWTIPHLDEAKPRHLLGIAEIEDLWNGVGRGIDLFDCVAPTRRGRHGSIYVSKVSGGHKSNNFVIQISNAEYILDPKPLDPNCKCYVCQNFTRSYICHLFRSRELLAYRLASYHNLYFVINLMTQIRESIQKDQFEELKSKWI